MKSKFTLFVIFILIVFGCNSNQMSSEYKDIFSLYLVKDSNQFYFLEKPALKDLVLEHMPLVMFNSITNYNWNNHLISFPSSTKEELMKREPLLHYMFVVIANDERIYWGLFTDDVDSYSCQNPVIRLLPRHPDFNTFIPDGFVIDRAYPEYVGNENDKDIRKDLRIYNALKSCGKLLE